MDIDNTSSTSEIDMINQVSLDSDDIYIGTDEISDIKDELDIAIDNEDINSDENINEDKNNNQTYRIVLILNDLDPTAPTEALTKILREFNFNFEIEKIERYSETKEQN